MPFVKIHHNYTVIILLFPNPQNQCKTLRKFLILIGICWWIYHIYLGSPKLIIQLYSESDGQEFCWLSSHSEPRQKFLVLWLFRPNRTTEPWGTNGTEPVDCREWAGPCRVLTGRETSLQVSRLRTRRRGAKGDCLKILWLHVLIIVFKIWNILSTWSFHSTPSHLCHIAGHRDRQSISKAKGLSPGLEMIIMSESEGTSPHILLLIHHQVNYTRATRTGFPSTLIPTLVPSSAQAVPQVLPWKILLRFTQLVGLS